MPPPSWLDDTVPYLTASVPALGGRIRSTPDDFCVEERPLYLPCGEGEHLYIRVKNGGCPRRISSCDLPPSST
jgi:tRNA pseudouridine13 synthase